MSTKRKRIFCGFPKAFCVKHLSLKIMFLVLSCDFRNFCNICKSSKVYLVRQVVYSITCSCLSIVTLCKKNNVVYQNSDICINNLSSQSIFKCAFQFMIFLSNNALLKFFFKSCTKRRSESLYKDKKNPCRQIVLLTYK